MDKKCYDEYFKNYIKFKGENILGLTPEEREKS